MLIAPRFIRTSVGTTGVTTMSPSPSLLEIEGETFVPLPYSNPDLPVPSHRIVQMQVPVSSLADAGVQFEGISNVASGADQSVLADILLGIDGQPLGVHVLGTQYQ